MFNWEHECTQDLLMFYNVILNSFVHVVHALCIIFISTVKSKSTGQTNGEPTFLIYVLNNKKRNLLGTKKFRILRSWKWTDPPHNKRCTEAHYAFISTLYLLFVSALHPFQPLLTKRRKELSCYSFLIVLSAPRRNQAICQRRSNRCFWNADVADIE